MKITRPTTYFADAEDSPTGSKLSLKELQRSHPSLVSYDEGMQSFFVDTPRGFMAELNFGWADTMKRVQVEDFEPLLGTVLASKELYSWFASLDIALIDTDQGQKFFVHYQEYGSSSCRVLHCPAWSHEEVEAIADYFEENLIDADPMQLIAKVDAEIHPYRPWTSEGAEEVPWIDGKDQEAFTNAGYAFIAELSEKNLI